MIHKTKNKGNKKDVENRKWTSVREVGHSERHVAHQQRKNRNKNIILEGKKDTSKNLIVEGTGVKPVHKKRNVTREALRKEVALSLPNPLGVWVGGRKKCTRGRPREVGGGFSQSGSNAGEKGLWGSKRKY